MNKESRLTRTEMMRFIVIALFMIAGPRAALAGPVTASGPTALALAAVVAQHSPLVRAFDNRVIARLFRGNTNFGFTPNTKISVAVDSIVCTSSNVDITMRSCKLMFSARNRTWERSLTGFQANEISATALAAGASSEGAAGSINENLFKLECTIDPNEIMKKTGGGAECTFQTTR
jgi:hypothetical protein